MVETSLAVERDLEITAILSVLSAIISQLVSIDSLSSLFQVLALAQASLLAIIVSVGLLSVQIAADQFTPLVGRRFEEKEFLTDAILRFGFSILIALFAMVLVPIWHMNADILSIIAVLALTAGAVGSGSYSFFSLIEVKNKMLDYLNPESILEELLEDVSFDEYRRFSEERQENGHTVRSPVLEIFQIGQQAFDNNDNHTAIYAIHTLDRASKEIVTGYSELTEAERKEVTFHQQALFDYWERLIDSGVEKGTDRTLYNIAQSLEEIAVLAAKNGIANVGAEANTKLRHLCSQALDQDRLEKSYYSHFNRILSSGLEHENPKFTRFTVMDIGFLMSTLINKSENFGEDRWKRSIVNSLFTYVCEAWSDMFEDQDTDIEFGDYRDLYDRFEEEVTDYITRCWSKEEAYPSDLESRLASVAKSAVKSDDRWAVTRISRMLIELSVITERRESLTANALARIIDAGGQESVHDAFEHIFDYEHIPDEELEPVIVGEEGWKRKSEEQDKKIYENVIRNMKRLNAVPGFEAEVNELQSRTQNHHQEYFLEEE